MPVVEAPDGSFPEAKALCHQQKDGNGIQKPSKGKHVRFEDAMYDVIALFTDKELFINFATSAKGLQLFTENVLTIDADNADCFKLMMRATILQWKQQKSGSNDDGLSSNLSNCYKDWEKHRKRTGKVHSASFVCHFGGILILSLLVAWNVLPLKLFMGSGDVCLDKNQAVKDLLQNMNLATNETVSEHALKVLGQPDYDIFPDTVLVNFYNTPVKTAKYDPEFGFKQQPSKISGDIIKMSEFFNEVDEHDTRYVALVGGVGYGKTEMLKRMAVDIFNKRHPALKDVEYIRFISLLDLDSNRTLTVTELLFDGVQDFDPEIGECALSYIYANQKKFLLILDGIDQFRVKLDGSRRISNSSTKGTTSEILSSLCSGHLMPYVRVLVSSREHAIRHFKKKMRPDKVIALSGFTMPAVEKLVNQFGGKRHQLIWERLNQATLLSLSSIPMYFFFTVTVLEGSNAPPKTSSELLMHILHHHVTSEHVTGNIIPLISKLKSMAFTGLKNDVGTFTIDDLPNGVSVDEVKDLLVTLPAVKLQNKLFFDGHFKLHFCHQSILEALAALFVAEMPIEEFEIFVHDDIHRSKWIIVRRMVCGLLLNRDTYDIAIGNSPSVGLLNKTKVQGDHLERKKRILRESLHQQLIDLQGDGLKMAALLELMHSLHESGDEVRDFVWTSAEEINLLNLPLAKNDVHVLLKTLSFANKLTFLSLASCRFDADDMFNLAATLKKNNVTITIMLVGSYEKKLGKQEAKAVLKLMQHVEDALWLAYRIDEKAHEDMQKIMMEYGRPEKVFTWWSGNGSMVIMEQ